MVFDRRALLSMPLIAAASPAFAQAKRIVPPGTMPVWPPAERFPLWPGIPAGAPVPPPQPRLQITGGTGDYHDIRMRGVLRPEVGVFRPMRPDGRALLVMPGGGYGFTSLRGEGIDIARALAPSGVTVFVLSYRLPGEGWADRANVPLADAQRAMRLIRNNALHWRIDPQKLGAIGFSAGGHLAGSLVTLHDVEVYRPIDAADRHSARPAFAGLMYAVSSMEPERSRGGSRSNLIGKTPDPAMQARYAVDRNLRPGAPPLFICHAEDDQTVPVINGLDLLAAARRAEIPTEAHILRRGGHGFGTRLAPTQPGSLWPQLFDRWMADSLATTS